MFCKNCGTKLRDGTVFCVNCGKPVSLDSSRQSSGQPVMNQQMNYGQTNPDRPFINQEQQNPSGQFPNQGQQNPVKPSANFAAAETHKSNKGLILGLSLGGVFLVAALVTGFLFFSGVFSKDEPVQVASDGKISQNSGGSTAGNSTTEIGNGTAPDDIVNLDEEPQAGSQAGSGSEPEENDPEAEGTEIGSLEDDEPLTMEECSELRSELLKQSPVSTSDSDQLVSICNATLLVDDLHWVDEQIMFEDIKKTNRNLLDIFMSEMLIYNGAFEGLLPHTSQEGGIVCSEDDLKHLLFQLYGRSPDLDLPYDEYCFEEVGNGKVRLSFGDGDPVTCLELADVFENDDYYLLSGPCIYYSNGDENDIFQYYSDFLFKKTPDNVIPATLVYCYTYDDTPEVKSIKASSHLKPYRSKTYTADNLIDDDLDTVWCEGASGVGKGQKVTIKFKKKSRIHCIYLVNGYVSTEELFYKNGRVTNLRLDFGSNETLTTKLDSDFYSYALWQRINLKHNVTTDKIVLEILDAKKGSSYSDTCVTEVRIY